MEQRKGRHSIKPNGGQETPVLHTAGTSFAKTTIRPGNNSLLKRRRRSCPIHVSLVTFSLVLSGGWFLVVQRHLLDSSPPSTLPERDSSWRGTSKQTTRQSMTIDEDGSLSLTFYMEPPSTLQSSILPLPQRNTSADRLEAVVFPVTDCQSLQDHYPIDNFPEKDPFLPWIHDVFSSDGSVHFVAQNKRRCDTGAEREDVMKFWEPQITLLQPVWLSQEENDNDIFRLTSPENATHAETRFLCHFHTSSTNSTTATTRRYATTTSIFPFDYEYVAWRKGKWPMFVESGRDVESFEFSTLLFSCPIPNDMQHLVASADANDLYVDVVPIRTPARGRNGILVGKEHVGDLSRYDMTLFDAAQMYGHDHVLPKVADSGRIANIPVCPANAGETAASTADDPLAKKKHRLAVCTWTSASYYRRGDARTIDDAADRLLEWILFHRLVGADMIYVYDNTQMDDPDSEHAKETVSPMRAIAEQFPEFVKYHAWPAKICNNNRPNHKNPGERSSQYAAEASCRERYGPLTEWMSFLDPDEYLVPMRNSTWHPILEEMQDRGLEVLKMKSSRGRPRADRMEPIPKGGDCVHPYAHKVRKALDNCLVPRRNETFLRVYNCEYIKPPRPERFQRAMKQIYRPSFVLSHFVHYSAVTADIARPYSNWSHPEAYRRKVHYADWRDAFLDEITEGVLVHAKSVLPYETMTRSSNCQLGSKNGCGVGYVCPESTPFVEEKHADNVFQDEFGQYCNCWLNQQVEYYWLPQLEAALETAS